MQARKLSPEGRLGVIVGICLAAGIGFLFHEFRLGWKVRSLSYDLLLVSRPHLHPQEAVIVYLDEVSHERLEQPLNAPWDRALHAQLVDRLTRAEARAVVFDIVFTDPNEARLDVDKRLAEAFQRNGRVVLAADSVPTGHGQKKLLLPFDLLLSNVTQRTGSAEMKPDSDLVVRTLPPNDDIIPSLSWAAAELTGASVTRQDGAALEPRWMNYYRPANATPSCRYFEALDTNLIADSFFSNKIVFVGARIITKFAGDRKDEYVTPHTMWVTRDENRFIAGVEIQATAFLNLLRGDWLRRQHFATERVILLLLGAGIGYSLVRLRPKSASILAAILGALAALAAYQLFLHTHQLFPWLIVEAQIAGVWLWSISYNSVRLYVEKRLLEQSLELYLSPKLVKKFAGDKEKRLLKPGAEKQKLTILFSDIENFTSLSEQMDSDELAKMLNEYFQSAVGNCIHSTDGTVVKYIGDAIFAFWNAPEPQSDHAVRACEAALRFREQNNREFHGRKLITRIGLHTGIANVGNFGSETRVDYTAIGEAINLASRMEGLNKFLGTSVLITGETKREIGDEFITRYLGKFQLKGFERTVEVHELLAKRAAGAEQSRPAEEFDTALRLFQQRDLGAAENAFQRALEAQPDDGATKFYSRHIAEVRSQSMPENWSGEVELKEK